MRVRLALMGVGFAIVVACVTMGMIVMGFGGIAEAIKYKQPVVVTYDEFVRRKPDQGWYRIKGCVLDVADSTGQTTRIVRTKRKSWMDVPEDGSKTHADTSDGKKLTDSAASDVNSKEAGKTDPDRFDADNSKEGTATLDKLYVPVHNAADSDEEAIPLLLETSASDYMDTYRELAKIDDTDTPKILEYMEKNEARLNIKKDLEGMVSAPTFLDEKTKSEVTRLNPTLTPDYRMIEERTPSLLSGIGTLIFGLLLAGVQFLIYRALLRIKPTPTMAYSSTPYPGMGDPSGVYPYSQNGPSPYTPYPHADESKPGWTPTKWR